MTKSLHAMALAAGLALAQSAGAATVTLPFDDLSSGYSFSNGTPPYCVKDSNNKTRCVTIFGSSNSPIVDDHDSSNNTGTNTMELSIFGLVTFQTDFKFSGISFDYFGGLKEFQDANSTHFGPFFALDSNKNLCPTCWDSVGPPQVNVAEGQTITFNGQTYLDNVVFYDTVDAGTTTPVPESSSMALAVLALGCARLAGRRRRA